MTDATAAQSEKPAWVWFSTHKTIENEIPSLTAIIETAIAVPLYWWVAFKLDVFWPTAVSVLVASIVLLRSDGAVSLGLKWMAQLEDAGSKNMPVPFYFRLSTTIAIMVAISLILYVSYVTFLIFLKNLTFGKLLLWTTFALSYWAIFLYIGIASALKGIVIGFHWLLVSFFIRFVASSIYIRSGIFSMPKNFRRITLCTSPFYVSEIIPGLENTSSDIRLGRFIEEFRKSSRYNNIIVYIFWLSIMFIPTWIYRITIKSTALIWWPLAFIGNDLYLSANPKLFHWKILGSLWAKASIVVAVSSLLVFAIANLLPILFTENALLTPFGYLLLIDWPFRPPSQILAVLGALLSLWIVFRVNDASGEYRIARIQNDSALRIASERKLGRTELLARVRLLVFIAFWSIVGAHALLYFNAEPCWFKLSQRVGDWADAIYGERRPPECQCIYRPYNNNGEAFFRRLHGH